MRRAHRVDSNHADVIGWFLGLKCTVFDTSAVAGGFPDLVVGVAGETLLVEVKSPGGKLTPEQEKFFAGWAGRANIVTTFEDCKALVAETRKRVWGDT